MTSIYSGALFHHRFVRKQIRKGPEVLTCCTFLTNLEPVSMCHVLDPVVELAGASLEDFTLTHDCEIPGIPAASIASVE